MTSSSKQRWHLIRESIKFQIKLTLDALRDLLLSPVAILCTLLDLMKGNSKHQGYFQRLMLWGHNTDHWLNLFGDLPPKTSSQSSEYTFNNSDNNGTSIPDNSDKSAVSEALKVDKPEVDSKLDMLFSKIETILEEQQQAGGLTTTTKQKIADYLAVLNTNRQGEGDKESSMKDTPTSKNYKNLKDKASENSTANKNE